MNVRGTASRPEAGGRRRNPADRLSAEGIGSSGAFNLENATEDDLLADLVHDVGQKVLKRLAGIGGLLGEQFFRSRGSRPVQELLGQLIAEEEKIFAFGDRGGFALQFDHGGGAGVIGHGHSNTTFGCGVVFALVDGFQARSLENFDGKILVAIGFREGFFAVHHRQVGPFSQFPDCRRCNFGH